MSIRAKAVAAMVALAVLGAGTGLYLRSIDILGLHPETR